ncbi:hypothetical protein BDV36DRAFT_258234 [Aspergillus pseudocaelatus]|uniref:Secreted protein n=1 Tax=Aspergillus pseudocaelatus TaxID=1825620 RepID=A0ABQ6WJ06_9EURO|nr:hypothetical protein BDV36DRAFT_258234 [Aspergillus pseudocaelatus]
MLVSVWWFYFCWAFSFPIQVSCPCNLHSSNCSPGTRKLLSATKIFNIDTQIVNSPSLILQPSLDKVQE